MFLANATYKIKYGTCPNFNCGVKITVSQLKLNNAYCSRWQLSTTAQGVIKTVHIKLLPN